MDGQPTVTYEADAIELEYAEGFGDDEHYELGDIVQLIDPDLKLNVTTRIIKDTHNPVFHMNGKVTISNLTSAFIKDISDTISDIKRSSVFKGNVYNGCNISPENGFVATKSDNTVRNTMNATVGNVLEISDDGGNTWTAVFSVTIEDGKALLSLVGRQKVLADGTVILESFKDVNGGKLAIYDNDGSINVRIGVEGDGGQNVGGTMMLFNDSIDRRRVALGIYGLYDSGFMILYGPNNMGRIYETASQNGEASIFLYDTAGNLKSKLTESSGTINGSTIATQNWVNQALSGYMTNDAVLSAISSAILGHIADLHA